jgi:hypothetical protein
MVDALPPIYFYIPTAEWPSGGIPDDIDSHWQIFNSGVFMTSLQTYLRLKADGFPCQFTGTLPQAGILIAHRDSVPFSWRPSAKTIFVCIQSDRLRRHPGAHFYLVHNPKEVTSPNSYFIPNWTPQPGMIPRSAERGDRIETIAFMGLERNLAPELRGDTWRNQLASLGLKWHVIGSDRWNDYSQVDVVVAIRSFDEQDYRDKPAVKLYNAWHAGVPAILGCESAYQAERKTPLDYFEAASYEDTVTSLKRLLDEPGLYRAVVDNGRMRSQETAPVIYLDIWKRYLTEQVVPVYQRWCKASPLQRQWFVLGQNVAFTGDRIQHKMSNVLQSAVARKKRSPAPAKRVAEI